MQALEQAAEGSQDSESSSMWKWAFIWGEGIPWPEDATSSRNGHNPRRLEWDLYYGSGWEPLLLRPGENEELKT